MSKTSFNIQHLKFNIQKKRYQLPLEPPVLTGFLAAPPAALVLPGFEMNLELPPIILPLLPFPDLPLFLLFTGNDIVIRFNGVKVRIFYISLCPLCLRVSVLKPSLCILYFRRCGFFQHGGTKTPRCAAFIRDVS
jgi:hypothetical protein